MQSCLIDSWNVHLKYPVGSKTELIIIDLKFKDGAGNSQVTFKKDAKTYIEESEKLVQAVAPLSAYQNWMEVLRAPSLVMFAWGKASASEGDSIRLIVSGNCN